MSTTTIDRLPTGEICSGCGEELVLELSEGQDVSLGCGCSCATTLA